MSAVLTVDARDPMPLYAQLERSVRFAIATGELRIGDQLPTVRQLAVNLRINANTVAKVYAELERSGILETRRGVGTFVRAREFEAVKRSVHQRELRTLVDKFVAEAAALGFSIDDLVNQLQSRRKSSSGSASSAPARAHETQQQSGTKDSRVDETQQQSRRRSSTE